MLIDVLIILVAFVLGGYIGYLSYQEEKQEREKEQEKEQQKENEYGKESHDIE